MAGSIGGWRNSEFKSEDPGLLVGLLFCLAVDVPEAVLPAGTETPGGWGETGRGALRQGDGQTNQNTKVQMHTTNGTRPKREGG